eukprot:9492708-Karenia_brevis.AAC.1
MICTKPCPSGAIPSAKWHSLLFVLTLFLPVAMVSGTGGAASGSIGIMTQSQASGLLIPDPNQGPLGEGKGRKSYKKNKGLRMCSVNITSSSKKAIWWITKVPYDVVFVQEHHKRLKR